MNRFVIALTLLSLTSGESRAEAASNFCAPGLSEASANFDQDGVGPFLSELTLSFSSGFSADQAKTIAHAIELLPVERSGSWEYSVTTNGKDDHLVIVAFKDDIDAPDLAFCTSPKLAAQIQAQLDVFAKARGW